MNLSRITRTVVSVTTALGMSAFGMASSAFAAQLTSSSVNISDSTAGAGGVSYAINFTVPTATVVQGIKFEFLAGPSNTTTVPTSFNAGASSLTSIAVNTTPATGWTLAATTGTASITNGSSALTTGNYVVTLAGISNPTDANVCDTVSGSESCYVRITTYSNTGLTTVIDSSVTTFTVVSSITVTATVDPYLTFAVTGVTTGLIAGDPGLTADTGTAVTGAQVTGTALPFGNISVGASKYIQQKLVVRTNAGLGYDVYHKFTTDNNAILKGVGNSTNKVQPFIGTGAATYGSPASWIAPTGAAANSNSSWVGMRAANTGTAGTTFSTSTVTAPNWAPPTVGNGGTGNDVKAATGPDNGLTGNDTYVSFKIEANAFQPADSYTGSMVYNVVAKY